MADTPEACAVIQRDHNRLEKGVDRNLNFNKRKCKALHFSRNNLKHSYMLEKSYLESSFSKKELGVQVDNKVIMS